MKERYGILYGGNIIQDNTLQENYHITTNKEDVKKIIRLLNTQEKELKEHNKTRILALILGLLIGLITGSIIL